MARVYICDMCMDIVQNPYEVRMKQFCVPIGKEYKEGTGRCRKKKIHLCRKCLEKLKVVAE